VEKFLTSRAIVSCSRILPVIPLYSKTAQPLHKNSEVLTESQGSTESCIAVRSSAALTGWPADVGFLCERAAVTGTG